MTFLSVVIPVHNSANHLRTCLDAIARNATDDVEIIVVDDGSTDTSAQVAIERDARVIKVSDCRGPAHARNLGADAASGELIWFLDADIEVPSNAIAQIRAYFSTHPDADAVIGSYDDAPADAGVVSQFKNLFHHYVHQEGQGAVSSFWTGCGVIRRKVFRQLGGFDANRWRRPAIEDIHFGYILRDAGFHIQLLAALQVKHHKRWTLFSMIRTDLFDRAIPWTRLLMDNHWRGGNELNLRPKYRLSVAAMGLACMALFAGVYEARAWFGIPLLLAIPLLLNRGLLVFFRSRRGDAFLLAAVPLLWIYLINCGVGLVVGVALGLAGQLREAAWVRSNSTSPSSEERRDGIE